MSELERRYETLTSLQMDIIWTATYDDGTGIQLAHHSITDAFGEYCAEFLVRTPKNADHESDYSRCEVLGITAYWPEVKWASIFDAIGPNPQPALSLDDAMTFLARVLLGEEDWDLSQPVVIEDGEDATDAG